MEVLYSTALVPDNQLIAAEPAGGTLLEQARQALAARGLVLQPIDPGHFVVSRAAGTVAGVANPALSRGASAPAPPVAAQVEEITVQASRYAFGNGVEGSLQRFSGEQIKAIPEAANDVIRVTRTLPGVAGADDVRPFVRGSAQEDVLVLFDDVAIAESFHLHGFQSLMSAFDASVVGGMEVYSGGYPARFGARSGGVIDLRPRSADSANEYSASAGTRSQRASTLGRTGDGDVEWLASMRRSSPNVVLEADGGGFDRANVLDALARMRWRLTAESSLIGGVLSLDDRIKLDSGAGPRQEADARYRDWYTWLSYRREPASGWASASTLSFAHSGRVRHGTVAQTGFIDGSLIEERSFKGFTASSQWTLLRPDVVRWNLGAELGHMAGENDYQRALAYAAATAATFGPGADGAVVSTAEPRETYYSAYGAVQFRPAPPLEAELGIRLDGQQYFAGQVARQLSPRIALRYRAGGRIGLQASWGRFTQDQRPNEWRLEENQQLPDPAQRLTQAVIGISWQASRERSWRLEAYRKRWTQVSPYFDNLLSTQSLLPDLAADRVRVAPEAADARGVELSTRGAIGAALSYWGSYSWSRASDQIAGTDVARSWDQHAAANAGLAWRHRGMTLAATLRYHGGWPRTPIALAARSTPQDAWLRLGARNSQRWPSFASTDLRASWTRSLGRSEFELFAEASNAADRNNVASVVLIVPEGEGNATSEPGYWLPRQYNIGVTWTWH